MRRTISSGPVSRERMARMLAERDSEGCVILVVFGGST
jgi:hypothetical protein